MYQNGLFMGYPKNMGDPFDTNIYISTPKITGQSASGNNLILAGDTMNNKGVTILNSLGVTGSVVISKRQVGMSLTGGDLDVAGTFTASLQEGYVWVGDSAGRTVTVATSSLVTNVNTGSLLLTASVNVNVLTFTKGDGSQFSLTVAASGSVTPGTISGSAQITALGFVSSSVTASSLITASAAGSTITFTKGDNTQFNVTLDTGSATSSPTIFEVVYTGENITKGDPLYISGSQGANPKVFKADAAVPAKMPVTFVANETIGVNNTTNAIILGLIEGIDLTGYVAGQSIYVAEGGGWSINLPSGSNSVTQLLGVVTKGGSGGKGLVLNPGPAQLPGLDTGKMWVGNGNNQPIEITTASFASSASFNVYTSSNDQKVDSLISATGSFATTGSNTFTGNQTLTDAAGNTITLTDASGSLVFVGKNFSQSPTILSPVTNSVNLAFVNEGNSPTNIISGSNNIFAASSAVTAGFNRFLTNGNIALSAIPNVSASMAFPIGINLNYLNSLITLRGPVSSSAYSIANNTINAAVNLGSGASTNFEKALAGANFNVNYIGGTTNFVASKTPLSASVNFNGNIVSSNGTALSANLNSSSVNATSNLIIGGAQINSDHTNNTATQATLAVTSNAFIGSGNIIQSNGIATAARQLFASMMVGDQNRIRLEGDGLGGSVSSTILLGQSLSISGSAAGAGAGNVGTTIVGRFNSEESSQIDAGRVVFAVGTGGGVGTRRTTLLIDSGSNTIVSGSLLISGTAFLNGVALGGTIDTGSLVTTSSFNTYTASTDGRLNNIESTTASLLIETQNLELFSASALTSLSNLNTATASLFTSASLALYTASVSGTTMTFTKGDASTFSVTLPTGSGGTIDTGSFATTGSNTFTGDQTISGSVNIVNFANGEIDTLKLLPYLSSSTFNGNRDTIITARLANTFGDTTFVPAAQSPVNVILGSTNATISATSIVSGSNNIILNGRLASTNAADIQSNQSYISVFPSTRTPAYAPVRFSNSTINNSVTILNNTNGLSASLALGSYAFGYGVASSVNNTLIIGATTINPNSSSVNLTSTINAGTLTVTGNKFGPDFTPNTGSGFNISNTLNLGTTTLIDLASGSYNFGATTYTRNLFGGTITATNISASTTNAGLLNTIAFGASLIITGSDSNAAASNGGSAFFGRYNVNDGITNRTSNTVFAVGAGTGTGANARTPLWVGTDTSVNVSGSLKVSGSTSLQGSTTFIDRNGTSNGNVYLGNNTLTNNTTGFSNVAIGEGALSNNTTGGNNFGLGVNALQSNTTGNSNFGFGVDSGRFASGSSNVFIGGQSGQNLTGSFNTIIGSFTGTAGDVLNNNIILADGNGNARAQYSGSAWSLQGEIKLTDGGPIGVTTLSFDNVAQATLSNSLINTASVILITPIGGGGGGQIFLAQAPSTGSVLLQSGQASTAATFNYLIINPI
jgi:hypothetical protein